MKSTILTLGLLAMTLMASSQQSEPSSSVLEAYSANELEVMSPQNIEILNARAEFLCWFEDVKDPGSTDIYQLTDRNGQVVNLSAADLATFNPLMYTLPQEQVKCANLIIQTTDGAKHLLVVRSIDMMEKQIARNQQKNAKAGK